MSNTNLFEVAARSKYRYQFRGVLTTEDLWDLSVENLDTIYRSLNAELKKASEESLLQTKSKADTVLENKIAIIKHIVQTKIEESNKKSQERVQRERRSKILEVIESKQQESLQNKSIEELQALLDEQ